jgi:hypothetical protein
MCLAFLYLPVGKWLYGGSGRYRLGKVGRQTGLPLRAVRAAGACRFIILNVISPVLPLIKFIKNNDLCFWHPNCFISCKHD